MAGTATGAVSAGAIRAAARISVLFCGTAVVSLPFAVRPGWEPRALLLGAVLLGCFGVAVQTFIRGGARRWAPVMLGTVCVCTGVVSGATDLLRPDARYMLLSWINSGVGGGLALTLGGRWGLAALLLGMGTAFGIDRLAGGAIALDLLVGPVTYVLGSTLARGAAVRGEALTEQALTARESAEASFQVAEQRWQAARAAQRELHDTVLATLTMLAHRGQGVAPQAVVEACVRDADLLRRGAVAADPAGHHPDATDPDATDPALVDPALALPDGPPPRDRGLRLIEQVETAAADARAGGFDVRVHSGARGVGSARVALGPAAAIRDALRECLRNARRHSGVQAADVTVLVDGALASVVVLDEGHGFDPGAVPADRLGLRDSVRGRMTEIGGGATIWSGPGLGTSILLTVPLAENDSPRGHDGEGGVP